MRTANTNITQKCVGATVNDTHRALQRSTFRHHTTPPYGVFAPSYRSETKYYGLHALTRP